MKQLIGLYGTSNVGKSPRARASVSLVSTISFYNLRNLIAVAVRFLSCSFVVITSAFVVTAIRFVIIASAFVFIASSFVVIA